jgi:succinoglycan biosynthesis protein ExoO
MRDMVILRQIVHGLQRRCGSAAKIPGRRHFVLKVSVIMANYRGARHLSAAIASVLRQTYADLELIVSDDASPDDSCAVVRAAMAMDDRVHLIETAQNAGPAAARNRAMKRASGDWIAIVDSDDLLHPQRLERLLAAADRLGADIIADDLTFFGASPDACGTTLLLPLALKGPLFVSPEMFLQASGEDRSLPALGYLKPMIRRSRMDGAFYDESLRIGEDFDLVLRLLLSGLRYAALPDPMYLYRRHGASISHRLSVPAVDAMLAAHDRLASVAEGPFRAALGKRRNGLVKLQRYEHLVAAIRTRDPVRSAAVLLQSPRLLLNLSRSLFERFSRRTETQRAIQRASVRLGVDAPLAMDPPLSLPCPAIPAAGEVWDAPPARMAAALSQLSALYDLSPVVLDDAGAWAADLLAALQAPEGP